MLVSVLILLLHAGGWDKNSTVGKHASSWLTQTVAMGGLADSFMAFNTNYHDTGLIGVYGVTDRDRCEDFAWAVMSALTRNCYDVAEADVARAKNQLKASLMFFQDSTHRESAHTCATLAA
jgi:processing peptidase subunit beta